MSIQYESLDKSVRHSMVEELELDQQKGTLYISPRLTDEGVDAWFHIVREAFNDHDDTWIASTLRSQRLMCTTEQRRKSKGGFTPVKVPRTAPDTLAEGEFNRFYIRGLCRDVLKSEDMAEVEVYRGKSVEKPRHQSEQMIGQRLPAQRLLEDLRTSLGVDTALGLPPGPNSGLTARRV